MNSSTYQIDSCNPCGEIEYEVKVGNKEKRYAYCPIKCSYSRIRTTRKRL